MWDRLNSREAADDSMLMLCRVAEEGGLGLARQERQLSVQVGSLFHSKDYAKYFNSWLIVILYLASKINIFKS